MRVTNKMIAQTVLNNLGTGLSRLQKLQDQMSSGYMVSRPSDNPVVATRVMTMNSVMKQHEQYERNVDDAIGWLEATDKALGNLTDALQRARELALYGANGTLSSTDRSALAQEVEQLTASVVQIANTSYAGRYIFAGTMTTTSPFAEVPPGSGIVVYSGNNGQLEWEVGQGVTVNININGRDAFIDSDVFASLNDLRTNLQSSGTFDTTILSRLDSAIDSTLNLRASMGAKNNRLEMALNRYSMEKINYEQLLSKLNDVDIAKIYTDFKMQEAVYQSALNTGARILQPTLLDFLR